VAGGRWRWLADDRQTGEAIVHALRDQIDAVLKQLGVKNWRRWKRDL
jgi:hypothetical protein